MKIRHVNSTFEREPLLRPFGFKGGYLSELWQSIVLLEADGADAVGLGTQSVLWSDSSVFRRHSEAGGNALMYATTEHALRLCREVSFGSPIELLAELLPPVLDYARKITNTPDLRKTFALNALVPLDNAAWMLFARTQGRPSFDSIIPASCRAALGRRHTRAAAIPTIAYSTPGDELESIADRGDFFIKVKLGQSGSERDMLEADMRRMAEVHAVFDGRETIHTLDGRIRYYLDMNGRYEEKATLERLLDYATTIGAFEQIVLVEEPFPEELEIDVSDLGVRVAADESAHTDADALRRIEMGYGAIALKPVAKTLSMTFNIARIAAAHSVPCFCADLTVNPILVDWNKNVAARLDPLPGLEIASMESNGAQNYKDWERMESYHPSRGAAWTKPTQGVYELPDEFYEESGGIFENPPHYRDLVRPPGG
jgi:L-alanine-DL-glutamate epimerase-like enolase superfamily enzyme